MAEIILDWTKSVKGAIFDTHGRIWRIVFVDINNAAGWHDSDGKIELTDDILLYVNCEKGLIENKFTPIRTTIYITPNSMPYPDDEPGTPAFKRMFYIYGQIGPNICLKIRRPKIVKSTAYDEDSEENEDYWAWDEGDETFDEDETLSDDWIRVE